MDKKYSIALYAMTQAISLLSILMNLDAEDRAKCMGYLIGLGVGTTILYIATAIRNPGYVSLYQNGKMRPKQMSSIPQMPAQTQINDSLSSQVHSSEVTSQRICKYCNNELKMRQKHCKECDKCVSTFDHHCTFLNNCIGEYNRPLFLLYLACQFVQIIVAAVCSLSYQFSKERTTMGMMVISALAVVGFLAAFLLFYHVWLMLNNLTTWEMLKANQIWYLNFQSSTNRIDKFNQGVMANLKMYWAALVRKQPLDWQLYFNPAYIRK